MAKNMQRRSFFSRVFGAAAVTAVAVEAKPAPVSVPTVRETRTVTPISGWMCPECGCAMWNSRNNTMRCGKVDCPNCDVPMRIPRFQAEVADSDAEELIRHALIMLGVLAPGMAIAQDDFKLCSEVLRRFCERTGYSTEMLHEIYPIWIADELRPYYKFGTE